MRKLAKPRREPYGRRAFIVDQKAEAEADSEPMPGCRRTDFNGPTKLDHFDQGHNNCAEQVMVDATHGTFEKCWRSLGVSALRGGPEVTGRRSNRRF
jgi:hypothetical protein